VIERKKKAKAIPLGIAFLEKLSVNTAKQK